VNFRWFAVDLDGFLGFFDSGAHGAVPTPRDRVAHAAAAEALSAPAGVAEYDKEPLALADRRSHLEDPVHEMVSFARTDDLPNWQPIINEHEAACFAAAGGLAVFWHRAMPAEVFQHLHESDLCAGCHRWVAHLFATSPAARGVYCFDHRDDGHGPQPYIRVARPTVPQHVDELPVELASKLPRLPVRFSDATRVQPAELVNCIVLGGRFTRTNGREDMEDCRVHALIERQVDGAWVHDQRWDAPLAHLSEEAKALLAGAGPFADDVTPVTDLAPDQLSDGAFLAMGDGFNVATCDISALRVDGDWARIPRTVLELDGKLRLVSWCS
jgi:hypothetical protein